MDEIEKLIKKYNLNYDGQWKQFKRQPYQFTDMITKSSILVYSLKDLPN